MRTFALIVGYFLLVGGIIALGWNAPFRFFFMSSAAIAKEQIEQREILNPPPPYVEPPPRPPMHNTALDRRHP